MKLFVDDKEVFIAETPSKLSDLIRVLKLDNEPGIAISVNGTIISILDYSEIQVFEQDQVEIIFATQGG